MLANKAVQLVCPVIAVSVTLQLVEGLAVHLAVVGVPRSVFLLLFNVVCNNIPRCLRTCVLMCHFHKHVLLVLHVKKKNANQTLFCSVFK